LYGILRLHSGHALKAVPLTKRVYTITKNALGAIDTMNDLSIFVDVKGKNAGFSTSLRFG